VALAATHPVRYSTGHTLLSGTGLTPPLTRPVKEEVFLSGAWSDWGTGHTSGTRVRDLGENATAGRASHLLIQAADLPAAPRDTTIVLTFLTIVLRGTAGIRTLRPRHYFITIAWPPLVRPRTTFKTGKDP